MRTIIIRSFIALVSLAFLGGMTGIGILVYFSFGLPRISTLADYKPSLPSQIISRDGFVLGELGKEKREIAEYKDVPKVIVDAFLSAEDSSFFEHTGVDYLGVMRAALANLRAGRVVQGGSTITQQVAKSLLLTSERSLTRKIKDFLLAQRIEEKFSKDEILYLYLNQVYLGGGYYGVKSAFHGYFGKELTEATIAEAAMVAGLLVAPGKYSPYINPKKARARQEYVLGRMLKEEKISKEEYDLALVEKTQYRLRKSGQFNAGYFTEWIRQQMVEKMGNDAFLTEGYRIQTTLDWELQKEAELQVKEGLRSIDRRQGYKGPLAHIESEKIEEELIAIRTEFFKKNSHYFTISKDHQKEFEFEFNEESYKELVRSNEESKVLYSRYGYLPGYYSKDPIFDLLNEGESYNGIVLKVNDIARMVFVSVMGITGVIPYEDFNWARKREILEERTPFPLRTKPSDFLVPGDKILVRLKSKSTTLGTVMFTKGKKKYKKFVKKFNKIAVKQKYLHLELDQEPEVEGAIVSILPHTGEIVVMVGGYNFERSKFNRSIQSLRQPGSAFKPLLFALGLENGYTASTILIDSPEALGGADESLNWKPRNYDGKFKGPMTFRNSLEQSRNVPTIRLADSMGVQKIHEFVDRIGFKAELAKDLSLSLGSFGVSLMDIVSTYSIFPNGGKKIKVKAISQVVDRYGNQVHIKGHKGNSIEETIIDDEDEKKEEVAAVEGSEQEEVIEEKRPNPYHLLLGGDQVYDPRLAYIMTNIMTGIIQHGTGAKARNLSNNIGGKTGTTNSYVDAWFIGFSSKLVTGVWTGFDNNKTMGFGETGSKSALPIWKGYMEKGIKKYGHPDFYAPPGIINAKINKLTGELAKPGEYGFFESFVEGTEPDGEGPIQFNQVSGTDTEDQIVEDEDYYNSQ